MTSVDYYCKDCNHHWSGEIITVVEPEKMKRICRNCKKPIIPKIPSFNYIVKLSYPNQKLSDEDLNEIKHFCNPSKIEPIDNYYLLYFSEKEKYENTLSWKCKFTIEPHNMDINDTNKQCEFRSPSDSDHYSSESMKIYRFICFNGSNSNGIAIACAESREEAISRILLCFNRNISAFMSRNYKIENICEKIKPMLKDDSEEEFFAAILKKYGWDRQRYYSEIGANPKDFFNNWGREYQCKNIEDLNKIIKKELEECEFIEYNLNDCAFYQGGA